MPLYDFVCRACHAQFEALVRPGTTTLCPSCQSQDLERLLSSFAVSTPERRQAAAAQSRKKQADVARRDTAEAEKAAERHRLEDH